MTNSESHGYFDNTDTVVESFSERLKGTLKVLLPIIFIVLLATLIVIIFRDGTVGIENDSSNVVASYSGYYQK